MPNEAKFHRQDTELIEEFVDYFTNGFSISGIASIKEERVLSYLIVGTSLSEVEIAQRCTPNQGFPLFCLSAELLSLDLLSPLHGGHCEVGRTSSHSIMESPFTICLFISEDHPAARNIVSTKIDSKIKALNFPAE